MKKIELSGAAGKGVFVLVDDEDYEKVKQFKWNAQIKKSKSIYATAAININGKWINIRMHRFILGVDASEKRQTDHINNNTLDNRKSNLRLCTSKQNDFNRLPKVNKKYSPYKGVCFHKGRKKFTAYIMFDDKQIHLGGYKTDREAALAYDKKAMELFGEYAYLNILKHKPKTN